MDTKKYTIVIDGVKESIKDVKSLKDAIDSVTEKVTIHTDAQSKSVKEEKAAVETRKAATKATDELSKVQEKLNQFDKEYAIEVARAKAELKSQNEEVKKAVQHENDLKVIEEQTLTTYRDKQNYLTSLNRTIRTMSDEEEIAGKSKKQLMQISEAVQLSLKNEDAEMAIYVRNVGNYASAVDGFADHMEEVSMSLDDIITAITNGGELDFNVPEQSAKSLKSELKELQDQMANMLANGVSPTDEGFLALAQRAGQLKDAMGDASAAVGHFASDTAALDNVINVVTTATASYGLLTSAMSAFGIENEEVAESIKKLQAVQTALNSLNALSKSLCDNSTMSYQLYHKALQAVGLEKTKLIPQTGALTVAEGAEATAATTAATATGSFAAALWAALAPLLVIVGVVGAVAAGIYGLVKAYEWLFGPTDAETKAMEAQTQAMMQLNAKTQENIDLLQSKGATEAQVLKESIQNYQNNIEKLDEYLQKCKDFYGEDSEEYKKALEEKQKAQDSFDKANLKGLQYLNKVRAKYHDEERKRTIGEVAFKKEKAKEEFDYQIKLLEELIKTERIGQEEAVKLRKELEDAYKLTVKSIDEDEAQKKKGGTTRGTGGSKGESDAEKAAKEFKKAASELAKHIQEMQKQTNEGLIEQQKRALTSVEEFAKRIKVVDEKSFEQRKLANFTAEQQELQIINASYDLKIKNKKRQWKEEEEKYKGHTAALAELEAEYTAQIGLLENQRVDEIAKSNEKWRKEDIAARKEYNQSILRGTETLLLSYEDKIEGSFKRMTEASETNISRMQEVYDELIPHIEDTWGTWAKFWDSKPENNNFLDGLYNEVDGFSMAINAKLEDVVAMFSDSLGDVETTMQDIAENGVGVLNNAIAGANLSDFQKGVMQYYVEGLDYINRYSNAMREEGKTEEEIAEKSYNMYQGLIGQMGSYKEELIDLGKIVGDVNYAFDAFGNKVYHVPTDGLSKSEKAASKWGNSMKKFLKKYVDPFKDAFDQMGESVNSVFDAINDWMQADIDRLADALDEITDKYNKLTDAVSNTEDQINSLKETYKTASASDRAVIGQKIADEEALLAQEKAAQNEAFNEQQRLDKEKEKLEKEQMKRQIEQQQFNAGISLINALISTAEGMSKEYAKGIFGIPTAVLIGVLGGIEVAAITAQIAALQAQKGRYADGGYVDGDGMLQGPSHKQGGIDILVGKKRVIEAEGGEFIINRKSSKKYYNLLTEINEYGKTGKTISGLNQHKFANGGLINSNVINSAFEGTSSEKQMEKAFSNIKINPKVSVVDIVKKTNDYNRVRAYAGRA